MSRCDHQRSIRQHGIDLLAQLCCHPMAQTVGTDDRATPVAPDPHIPGPHPSPERLAAGVKHDSKVGGRRHQLQQVEEGGQEAKEHGRVFTCGSKPGAATANVKCGTALGGCVTGAQLSRRSAQRADRRCNCRTAGQPGIDVTCLPSCAGGVPLRTHSASGRAAPWHL